jgi:hypothetical protein
VPQSSFGHEWPSDVKTAVDLVHVPQTGILYARALKPAGPVMIKQNRVGRFFDI